MKVVVVDITGRNAAQYNPSLCKALGANGQEYEIILLSPTLYDEPKNYKWVRLLSLVPKSINSSSGIIKRLLRAIDLIINYLFIICYSIYKNPDIIHFQWLPFLEVSAVESIVLSVIKYVSPRCKIALTVHNIYPHEMGEKEKQNYVKRFTKVDSYIDGYMVHLNSSRKILSSDFNIPDDHIYLTYHGIYEAKGYEPLIEKDPDGKVNIIMFGYQTKYKGADILIEALKLLPPSYLSRTRTLIVGKSDIDLYSKYESITSSVNTTWINKFVSEKDLYQSIGRSDLILLPYRTITQSGVLLLALSYMKPILTSDLPSFKETLEGYPHDYFFEAGNPKALRDMLMKYIDGGIDSKILTTVLEKLNKKYSWEETGKSTLCAYKIIRNGYI